MYYFGPFRLDPETLLLSVGKQALPLGPKVVQTLLALAERPGETITKNELLDLVWPEGFVEESNLAQNVYVLRKVLRAHWNDVIETVPRRGYRFAAAVSTTSPPRAPSRFYYAAAAAALALATSFAFLHDTARSRPAPQQLSAGGAGMYAMGKYYWNQRTRDGLHKSVRYFASVIKTDPKDARGYAALAEAYALEGDYGYGPLSYHRSYAVARAFARRALALDANSAEAHAALGIAEDLPATRKSAQREYLRAIQLDPSSATAHQWYGSVLLQLGRERESFAELRKAAELNPVSVATLAWLAEAAYYSRRYPDAIAYAREALDLSPQRVDAYYTMGLAYEAMGNYYAAEASYREFGVLCKMCRADAAALLAHAYAGQRDFDEAERQLAIARTGRDLGRAEPGDMAFALVALGRRSEALATLHHGGRRMLNAILAIEPRLDSVRGDERFRPYLRPAAYTT